MKGTLRIVRESDVKLTLPGPSVVRQADGTLWLDGNPILGISDPAERKRVAALTRAGKYGQIPAIYFTRLGYNPNGLWAGMDEAWAYHPAKIKADQLAAAKAAEAAKQVSIYLSSRGWGDYPACKWEGDITRPDAEILAECKHLLFTGHLIDHVNQADDEILAKIAQARAVWKTAPARKAAREAAEKEDLRRKISAGYCFVCESYCYGDCGHYSKSPHDRYRRQANEAACEFNYGISN